MTSKLVAVLSCLAVLVVGIWLGGHPRYLPSPVADVLVGSEDRRVALEGLDEIHAKYYRPIARGELSDAALKGAVSDLHDRFSAYFSSREYALFNRAINNQFSGVGMVVRGVKAGLLVVSVYPGAPAQQAGIRAGDVITQADRHRLAGLAEPAATAFIKGREGTQVTLRVRRGSKTIVKRLTRATISVPVVESKIANAGGKRAAYIALSTFGPSTAHEEVAAAIRKQRARGAKGIVLDLRGNGGGLVSEAQLIASMFLPNGPIVTTKGRAVETKTLYAVGKPIAGALPTVVLVDGGTASAAEIVAGALQDRKRATIVGVKTFGKGVFQEIMPLSNGGALDITVGQYFLPSGRNLGGVGVGRGSGLKPDVAARDDPNTPARDEALVRALAVLARKL
ncbi:MAG: carboxyl-terminal processing protease [Solirubrobacteraceae bacterium]|nr:carboxyl-terminal processing protease [Solirubrobacteraceae bacterium]